MQMESRKIYHTRENWILLVFKERPPEPEWTQDKRRFFIGMCFPDASFREGFSSLHDIHGINRCMEGMFNVDWSIPAEEMPELFSDGGTSYMSGGKRWEET